MTAGPRGGRTGRAGNGGAPLWTDAEAERARSMRAAGATFYAIGIALGRSHGAVSRHLLKPPIVCVGGQVMREGMRKCLLCRKPFVSAGYFRCKACHVATAGMGP